VQSKPVYSLEQLAEASGQNARTIRSWINEGLLPPAFGGGRGAFYGTEHMERLRFIRRVREETGANLPLAWLKDVLDQLYAGPDPDVVRRVGNGEESLQVAGFGGAKSVLTAATQKFDPSTRSVRGQTPSSRGEQTWTSIQIQGDLELRLKSDDPDRVAWLARLARRVRDWLREAEP
jgi:DNA-binding transcriptional MerR regulator